MPLSSHASRWLVAAVAAPIILLILLVAPAPVFFGLIAAVGLLTWQEYFAVFFPTRADRRALTWAWVGWLIILTGMYGYGPYGALTGLFLALAVLVLYYLFTYGRVENWMAQLGGLALGHLYVSLFLTYLVGLFLLPHGRLWVLFSLLVTFLGDTAAFYTGRTIGKRPLHERVSPKKTVEGLFGNMAGCAVVGGLCALFLVPTGFWATFFVGMFLGLWGQIGDLFESMIKRSAGVKDSGTVLMGHGGLWDRIDALIFNAPVIYYFALLYGA
jgi:phosphatidate cytidylyltransferase